MENNENNNWHDGEIQPIIQHSVIYEYSNDMEPVFALDLFFRIPDGTKEIEGIQVPQFRDADDKPDFKLIFQREFDSSPFTRKDEIKIHLKAKIKRLLKGFKVNDSFKEYHADIYARTKRFIEWLSETKLSELPAKQTGHIIEGELFNLAHEAIQENCLNPPNRDKLFEILNNPTDQITWTIKDGCKGRFYGLIRVLIDNISQKDIKETFKKWAERCAHRDAKDLGSGKKGYTNFAALYPELFNRYKSNKNQT